MSNERLARLAVTAAGFAIIDARGVYTIALRDIVAITAYKRDLMTIDLVCWDVVICADAERKEFTLHEDLPGFDAVAAARENLPGFYAGWRETVLPGAFAANVCEVYRRSPD